MLVAMTFNVGLFVCVIAGLALGTLMFGHILAAEPTVGSDGMPSLALKAPPWLCYAARASQCCGWQSGFSDTCNYQYAMFKCIQYTQRQACSWGHALPNRCGHICHGWIAYQHLIGRFLVNSYTVCRRIMLFSRLQKTWACACVQARDTAVMATLGCLLRRTARLPMPDAAAAHDDCAPPFASVCLSLRAVCLFSGNCQSAFGTQAYWASCAPMRGHRSPWFARQDIDFGQAVFVLGSVLRSGLSTCRDCMIQTNQGWLLKTFIHNNIARSTQQTA